MEIDAQIASRFWSHVDRRGKDECWIWRGAKSGQCGHGQFWVGSRRFVASRFSWEMHNGTIPAGFWVLHRCDVGSCVNPGHLFLGTPKENTQDMMRKGRQGDPTPRNPAVGSDHGKSLLTEEAVREIRTSYVPRSREHGERALARKFGVSTYCISDVIRRRSWAWVL